ncbi:MAG TPA: RDD family protein [Chitinophagaceae bacterium]
MSTISITTTQNIELEYDLASLGERIAGRLIDGVVLGIYLVAVFVVFFSASSFNVLVRENIWLIILFVLPVVFYDLVCETAFNGQSLGKKLMNIRVVSLDGEQPSLGQYLIRWLFRLFDFTFTSSLCALILVAVTERRQRLGDLVAGTTLVRTTRKTGIQQTLFMPNTQVEYDPTYPEVANLSDSDMQLVKEVLINVQKSGNTMLALQAKNKIEQVLGITSTQDPVDFLYTVLADYNLVTSKL